MKTIVEKIYENSLKCPDRLAVVFEDEEITYKDLWRKVLSLYSYLKNSGISKGDKIVVQTVYSVWYVISCYAAHLCGAIFIPIDKNSSIEAIEDIRDMLSAEFIISNYTIKAAKGSVKYSELSEAIANSKATEFLFPDMDAPADIMFTTGTTGAPKGVVLTHKNISTTAVTRIHEINIMENNVGITFVPLNHVAPMRELYLNGYNGSTFIFLDGMLKIKKMFQYMERYGVTSMYIPPSGITVINQFSGKGLAAFAEQIDYVYTASSSMNEVQQIYMRESLPKSRLYFSYGSSENGSVSLHRYHSDIKEVSCVGKPCEGVSVKIADDEYNELPCGQVGTVIIKSNMNFMEYYNRQDLTDSVYKDGYFVSNDAGFYDEEGFLYVVGRKDDMVNIGGLKVYPSEIEDAATKIEAVEDCICVPVEDKITGQAIKLIVKKKADSDCTAQNIRSELMGKLDSYKLPKLIEFADSIERTSNGKLNRKAYR